MGQPAKPRRWPILVTIVASEHVPDGCTGVSSANFCFLMQMSTKLCRTLHSFAEGMLVTNKSARGSEGGIAEAVGHS
jgi:zinc transporter ZupT